MPNPFNKKSFITFTLGLLSTSLMGDRAIAVIYDFNFALNNDFGSGTAIGTIQTLPENNSNALGDYANNDFSFGNYEIELTVNSSTFTLNNNNNNILTRDLEAGDLVANINGLFLDLSDPVDSQGDVFEIVINPSLKPDGEDFALAFTSSLSGSDVSYQSAIAVDSSVILNSDEINYRLGTEAVSAAVPFEFSPGAGILMVAGFGSLLNWYRRK